MKNQVILSEVLSAIRENGHLGFLKIIKPKNQPQVDELGIAVTLFKKNYIDREKNDEILIFRNKQLNISSLENKLTIHLGDEVNLFVGNKYFIGKLLTTYTYKN